jgi:hypothetical protein
VSDRISRVPYLPGRGCLRHDQAFRIDQKVASPPARAG